MPVKPEVINEFFGYDPEKFENDEAFKEAAAKDWTKVAEAVKHPEIQKAVTGRVNGVFEMKTKQAFKELDLSTEGVDFSVPAEAVLILAQSAKKAFSEREGTLTEKLKGKGSEELKQEYERQLSEAGKKVLEYEGVNSSLRGEIEKRDKAEKDRELNGKVDMAWNTAKIGLKFKQGMSKLEEAGFDTEARKRFQVRFDEHGESYWAGQDGNRIPDGSKHQAFKDGQALLKDLAKELKVDETNPRGGERVGTPTQRPVDLDMGERKPFRRIATPGRVLNDNPQAG